MMLQATGIIVAILPHFNLLIWKIVDLSSRSSTDEEQGAFDMSTFDIMLSTRTARVNIVLFLCRLGPARGTIAISLSGFPRRSYQSVIWKYDLR